MTDNKGYIKLDDEEPLVITITSCKGKHENTITRSPQGQPKSQSQPQTQNPQERREETRQRPLENGTKSEEPSLYEEKNNKTPSYASKYLPIITPRYHGPGCSMEIAVLEKHDEGCRFKKLPNSSRYPEDSSGAFEYIGRLTFKTCGAPSKNSPKQASILEEYHDNSIHDNTSEHIVPPRHEPTRTSITSRSRQRAKSITEDVDDDERDDENFPILPSKGSIESRVPSSNRDVQTQSPPQQQFHVETCFIETPTNKSTMENLLKKQQIYNALSKYSPDLVKTEVCVNNVTINSAQLYDKKFQTYIPIRKEIRSRSKNNSGMKTSGSFTKKDFKNSFTSMNTILADKYVSTTMQGNNFDDKQIQCKIGKSISLNMTGLQIRNNFRKMVSFVLRKLEK